jgi:Asp-tRNA(Asn)/Glu-tRNA(Gln) amidotransferase A subunit family amidase
VQLVGRPFGEARLLAMAQALSADIGWSAHPLDRVPGRAT